MTRPCAVPSRPRPVCWVLPLLAAALLAACSDREEPVAAAPARLPASLAARLEAEGVGFQAQALEDGAQAAAALGFDAPGAGLLPVRISIDNQGGGPVRIVPRQTFLIDAGGDAWPLLTSTQALARLERAAVPARAPAPGELETFTAFALDLVAGPAFSANPAAARAGERASRSPAEKSLRNPAIQAGQVASGVLFFPGGGESRGARGLRLCYEQGASLKFLMLPLGAPPTQ